MMTEKWPEVYRSLRRAKTTAERRLTEIENERREIKASVKSLDAALRALGQGDDDAKGAERKIAATTSEVIEMVIQILTSDSRASVAELTKRVGDRLATEGRSRAGLKLRLAQALEDRRFRETPNGFELTGSSDRPSSNAVARSAGSK
jgi:ribosome recycling factor